MTIESTNANQADEFEVLFHELHIRDIPSKSVFERVLERTRILSGRIANFSGREASIARLYFELLVTCPRVYAEKNPVEPLNSEKENTVRLLPDATKQKLLTVFENLSQLTQDEGLSLSSRSGSLGLSQGRSFLYVLWFLKSLHDTKEGERFAGDQELLSHALPSLLEILGDIDYVFDINEGERPFFPIRTLLVEFIGSVFHGGTVPHIGPQDVRLLQLAVRLFKSEEERGLLRKIIEDYNLRFVEFLENGCRVVDTNGLENLKANGVLVFWDEERRRVLVRSEHEEYFKTVPTYKMAAEPRKTAIEYERDLKGNRMGVFSVFEWESGVVTTSVSELAERDDGMLDLLKVLYDQDARNVLVGPSLVRARDGSVYPLNPWCAADQYIIAQSSHSSARRYSRNHVMEAFKEYRLLAVKLDSSAPLNRVTFGLCVRLLDAENTGVNSLGLDKLKDSCWYQAQVVANWASGQPDVREVRKVLGEWSKQIGYRADKKFEETPFHAIDFLPLRHNHELLYSIAEPTLFSGEGNTVSDQYILCRGRVNDNTDGGVRIFIRNDTPIKRAGNGQAVLSETMEISRINDQDGILKESEDNEDLYVFCSFSSGMGLVLNQSLSKLIWDIDKVDSSIFSLDIEVGKKLTKTNYDEITQRMKLFADAHTENAAGCYVDGARGVDSILSLRLLHNILWAKLDEKSIVKYIKLILQHSVLDFEWIGPDSDLVTVKDGTLLIPKDERGADAVLKAVLEEARPRSRRQHDPYDCSRLMYKKDGVGKNRYFIMGQDVPITRVVFVTDNILSGTANCSAIMAYLNLKSLPGCDWAPSASRIERARDKMMRYIDESGHEVSVEALTATNDIKKFEVYSCYASEEGLRKVQCLLDAIETIKDVDVRYGEIVPQIDIDIMQESAQTVWPDEKVPPYPVIRKYNMTARSVFPKAMLEYPERYICLFVRKAEMR